MRLKRVEMTGFKSFMDRTVLDFRRGITSILGPNGCGKSNVVDAVRWVLGEQSAKQLRGEKMEDVIFKGSRKRKPLSMAEVSLVFDNSDQALNTPYDEVAITRRVARSGNSEYFLNKTSCRLKDIKDLFYDTGVGNNAYSVIEQEVVGQVLDANENKVRTILEEGSGIVRYKVKRKEALRKLDLTERDLLRVEDIIEEIGRQVRSLARQVGKARRHQRLFGELRSLELIRAFMHLSRLRTEIEALEEQEQQLRSEGSGDDATAAKLNARIADLRPQLDECEQERRERALALSSVETELNGIEGELLVLREKIEAGGRRHEEIGAERARSDERSRELQLEREQAEREQAQLLERIGQQRDEVAELERQVAEIEERRESARSALAQAQQLSLGFIREEADQKRDIASAESRLESLREEQQRDEDALSESDTKLQQLREELAGLKIRLEAAEARRLDCERELSQARSDVEGAESRLQEARALRESTADDLARAESRQEIAARIAQEYEGYRAGAAALLRDRELGGRVKGALAERLRVEKGYENAFELLFGEDADALLVEEVADARELADRLAHEDLGLASFVAAPPAAHRSEDGRDDLPGRAAAELVRIDGEVHGLVHRWLERVRVVESNDEAVEALLNHAGESYSFVSREGLFLRHDGLVRGGAGARRQLSIFGRQEQLETLGLELERLHALLDERQAQQDARGVELERAKQMVQQRLGDLTEITEEASALASELASRQSVLQREMEHRDRALEQVQAVQGQIDSILEQVEDMHRHLGRHGEDQERSQRRVDELGAQVTELEAQREAARSTLSEARLQLTRDEGMDHELGSRLQRIHHMLDELFGRTERLVEEERTLTENRRRWQQQVTERDARSTELYSKREERQESLRKTQEIIEERRADLEAAQDELRAASERQRKKADALLSVETELTRLDLTGQNVRDRIREKFHVDVEEGYQQIDDAQLPKELLREENTYQLAQVEELLAQRQEKLDKIGPVNFVALDEYEEKKARLEFLQKQRDDLLQSKEDLLQAIDRINRTARQLFRETFEQVRSNFRDIFQTLFSGGEAELLLANGSDPLESDIQVVARPKGKRVDNVSLLSGGERALTAIALLFAVYLIKPSPFCLLDEVDAPLDDMNIGRFVRLLERFADRTQFIVITHNKLTMEAAEYLYGVTMEESGVSRLVSVSFAELDVEDPIAALEDLAAAKEETAARSMRKLQSSERVDGGNGDRWVAEAAAGAARLDPPAPEAEV